MSERQDKEPLASIRIRIRVSSPPTPQRPMEQPVDEPSSRTSYSAWIVVGLLVFVIFALVRTQSIQNSTRVPASSTSTVVNGQTSNKIQPTPSPTLSSEEKKLKNEVEEVVRRFNAERHRADENLDTSRLSSVATGPLLDKQIGVVATLAAAHCAWRFDSDSMQVERIEIIGDDRIRAFTREGVRACLYCNSQIDQASYDGDFKVVYIVEKIAGQWYVSQRDITDELRNDSAKSSCPSSPER